MDNIEIKKEDKLNPAQYVIIKKIKKFLLDSPDLYKIEWNNIYINDIKVFKKVSELIDNKDISIVDWIDYKSTKIKIFNNQYIILEFDDEKYLKIINKSSLMEYFKYIIKNILW